MPALQPAEMAVRVAPHATASGALSFDQAPPLAVPLRFFLSAPLFLLLAALLLAVRADEVLDSRWSPAALAVTHLLTLGFLGQVMAGALFQILPVLGGAPVLKASAVAAFVHVLLAAGTLALTLGFLLHSEAWLRIAATLLGSGWGIFLVAAGHAAWIAPSRSATLAAIRLALTALLVTVLLGLALIAALSGGIVLDIRRSVDLHGAWGFVGWIGLLAIGVAYQVVPMFQLTPHYATSIKRWLVPVLFGLLWIWTLAGDAALLGGLAGGAAALLLTGFAAATLLLQRRKRRPGSDVSVSFWRLGMVSLAAAALLWIVSSLDVAGAGSLPPSLFAVLFLLGFAASVVNGMLYKIVPFLVWFHLSSRQGVRGVPLMNAIVPARWSRLHLRLHLAAVTLILAATATGHAVVLTAGALLLAGSAVVLGSAIARAYRVYLRHMPTS